MKTLDSKWFMGYEFENIFVSKWKVNYYESTTCSIGQDVYNAAEEVLRSEFIVLTHLLGSWKAWKTKGLSYKTRSSKSTKNT